MRTILLAFLLLFSTTVSANMANPIREGTLGARPFASNYIDILHEDLKITLQRDSRQAAYEVEYRIQVLKDSLEIPFLFVAMEYSEGFRVTLDGKEVEVLELPEDLRGLDSLFLGDFDSLFGGEVNLANGEKWPDRVELEGMKYFKTDLTAGEHVIKVWYTGIAWEDRWDWTKKYSFRYALSPAKYWKSFGSLSLTVDASDWASPTLVSNLGPPEVGDLQSVAKWNFDGLPNDVIVLEDQFEVPAFAQTLINIGPFWVAAGLGLVLALVQLFLMWKHRKRKPRLSFSWIVIIGCILVPVAFLLFWLGTYSLVDSMLGEEATGTAGYGSFIFALSLPIWILIYAAVMFLADFIFVRLLQGKNR